MKQLVIDASVAVKWLLPEPGTEQAMSLLANGTILHSPDLLFAEVTNVLWKRVKNTEISTDAATKRLSILTLTDINIYPSKDLILPAIKLATQYDHSVYDCIYLVIATKLGCPMITADIKFINKLSNTHFKQYLLSIYDNH